MSDSLLDTSVLIEHWRVCWRKTPPSKRTRKQMVEWAGQLIQLYRTKAIVTPVYIEVVAGVTSEEPLDLTRAFLAQFRVVDDARILPEDWKEALRLAQRIPRDGKPRQLGDCLIRAIARRLNYEVITLDQSFPT